MGVKPKAVIGHIDREEAETQGSEPFVDVLMIPIPMPLYRSLSDAASRQGISVAALVARGFTRALEE